MSIFRGIFQTYHSFMVYVHTHIHIVKAAFYFLYTVYLILNYTLICVISQLLYFPLPDCVIR